MKKMVLVTVDNEVKILDYPTGKPGSYMEELRGFYKAINCDCVENVRPRLLYEIFEDVEKILMLVDESGLINGKRINPVGSFLYGVHEHGNPIVGDVLFVSTELTFDGPTTAGMEEEYAKAFAKKMECIIDIFAKPKEEVI